MDYLQQSWLWKFGPDYGSRWATDTIVEGFPISMRTTPARANENSRIACGLENTSFASLIALYSRSLLTDGACKSKFPLL